ncbi:MAG TPA: helix-turn-helix domain-containing protein [Candidatus Udaeobacter sp.]|nr:helix-turn-helix domain-containing protein [Candidatus Udaeobacter sp.]
MGEACYREYPIPPTLACLIKCIWSLESDHAIYDAPPERILPDGCVELVFHFQDPFRTRFANGRSAVQPRSFVVGQMKRFLEIAPLGRIGFIAVRFHASSAYRFFPRSLNQAASEVIDLREILKSRAGEWTDRVALARGMGARVRIVEEALLGSLRENGRQDRMVDRCLQLIETGAGQSTVVQLASEIGASSRQLTRRFQNAVGVSPKEFSRVSRFLYALRCLRGRKHLTLTETALVCGYFDQAHFNHEFREFAGMAPGELFTFPNVAF